MTAPSRILAVTGAGGYIGARLCAAASAARWDVLALSRRPFATSGCRFVSYDLEQPLPPGLLVGVSTVIHLAADTGRPEPGSQVELVAARRMIEACRDAGARFVFVSSQAAAENAPTGYGRLKWSIERLVLDAGGTVVRPGLVYGGPEAGLFGRLCALVRRLPVLPALWPDAKVQPIHVDDLSTALLAAADPDRRHEGVFEIASSGSISFSSFLRAIARHRLRKSRLFVPFPRVIVTTVLHAAFRISGRASIHPARLMSLLNLRFMDTAASNTALGLSPRNLVDGMHPRGSSRRRNLIREGRSLLTYLAGGKPSRALLARYVRAIERFDGGEALRLRSVVHAVPSLLSLVEGPRIGPRDVLVGRRIDIAFQIAEASVFTKRFLLTLPIAWPLAAMQIAIHSGWEIVAVMLRSLFGSVLHPRSDRNSAAAGR
jgi:nucleoside-diphosphate-sugar epimerase